MLHTFSDKSILKKYNVKELIGIPIWRGNRHIDMSHVKQIKQDVRDNISCLDSKHNSITKIIEKITQSSLHTMPQLFESFIHCFRACLSPKKDDWEQAFMYASSLGIENYKELEAAARNLGLL